MAHKYTKDPKFNQFQFNTMIHEPDTAIPIPNFPNTTGKIRTTTLYVNRYLFIRRFFCLS